MTREEIKNTPELIDFLLDESILADSRTKVRKRLEEVCNLATKALEQQLCDDVISQIKERIAYYENRKPKDGYDDGVSYGKTEDESGELKNPRTVEYERYSNRQIGLEEALEIIQNHSVTQKYGKWILSGGYWRCSKCKEKALLKFDKSKGGCREYKPVRSKHCPNCGAKMQESEE